MADTRWRIQNGGYFNVENVILTSLLLLMTTNLLPDTIISLDMLLLRLCGYPAKGKRKIDEIAF